MEAAAEILKVKNEGKNISKLRMIADHARAVTFLISDGILPSNEGRGYVLRRILRRAARQGKLYGNGKPFMHELASSVLNIMNTAYPDLSQKLENIKTVIKTEEEKFLETLEAGSAMLAGIISSYKAKGEKVIGGKDVFKLYDTYGFPHDLTKEIASENQMLVDEDGFKAEQKAAQEKSRAAWGGSGEKDVTFYSVLHKKTGDTDFVGYSDYKSQSKVSALTKDGTETGSLKAGDEGEMILDKSPFYAQSGGQNADAGKIYNDNFAAEVFDVAKPIGSLFVHKIKILSGEVKTGCAVNAEIDAERRKQTARHHTATHLLQKALREVFGNHITQAGSLVSSGALRFDFTHFNAVKKEELVKIENRVNAVIRENIPVCVENMKIEDARKAGATALFGEKYGDVVRTVTVKSEDEIFSMELCGGTHVQRSGDIGFFKIVSESSVAAGVRRIEAVAGLAAEKYVLEEEAAMSKTAEILSSSKDELVNKASKQIADYKKLEQELNSLKSRLISGETDNYARQAKEVKGFKFLSLCVAGQDVKSLREMSDKLKEKLGSAILIIASKGEDKASFIVSITQDYVKLGLNAGKIAKSFAYAINGSGGGKPDFAQGGSKDVEKIEAAVKNAESFL
jgi:alanyl-tRNA synthetase